MIRDAAPADMSSSVIVSLHFCPPGMLIVTPGIQLHVPSRTDQARMATPAAAAVAGATHIVIGRAITQAADPVAAYKAACILFKGADG